jgi:hypothetical protein
MKRVVWFAVLMVACLLSIFLSPSPTLALSQNAYAIATVTVMPKIEKEMEKYASLYADIGDMTGKFQYKQQASRNGESNGQKEKFTLIVSETL